MLILTAWIAGIVGAGFMAPWPLWLSITALVILIFSLLQRQWMLLASINTHFVTVLACLCAAIVGSSYMHERIDAWQQTRINMTTIYTGYAYIDGLSEQRSGRWSQMLRIKMTGHDVAVRAAYPQWDNKSDNGTAIDAFSRDAFADEKPGDIRWVRLRLKPIHGNASPGVFDLEAWALSEHISANADILELKPIHTISSVLMLPSVTILQQAKQIADRYRLTLRMHMAAKMQKYPQSSDAWAILLALLTGDRSLVSSTSLQQYQDAGISHLLAISGPHVLVAAMMATWLFVRLLMRRPRIFHRLAKPKFFVIGLMIGTTAYASLAGWSIPVLRTWLTVLSISLLYLTHLAPIKPRMLLPVMALLLLLDPLAVLSSSFWLSFGSVAILLLFVDRQNASQSNQDQQWTAIRLLGHWLWINMVIFIALAPLMGIFFGQISLISPLVNSVMVPLYGLIILPLNMLGLFCQVISPQLGDAIWQCAVWLISVTHHVLAWLSSMHDLWVYVWQPTVLTTLLAGAAIFLALSPITLRYKWICLPLIIPFVVGFKQASPLRIAILDVGQGLSVFIQTAHHQFLYDAGGYLVSSGTDMGERVVVPTLRSLGIRQLDEIMISHLDLDHVGGLNSVLKELPVASLRSSDPLGHYPTKQCAYGQSWQWDDVQFSVLAPSDAMALDENEAFNERSCILRVSYKPASGAPEFSILLMGDVGFATETWLIRHVKHLQSTVLVLGHHGSRHSSSVAFLHAVAPQDAIVSAGFHNRYGHPHAEVVERVNHLGIRLLSTIEDGTIIYTVAKNGEVQSERYRLSRQWLNPMRH